MLTYYFVNVFFFCREKWPRWRLARMILAMMTGYDDGNEKDSNDTEE